MMKEFLKLGSERKTLEINHMTTSGFNVVYAEA